MSTKSTKEKTKEKVKNTVKTTVQKQIKKRPALAIVLAIVIIAILVGLFILTPTANPLDGKTGLDSEIQTKSLIIDENLALPAYNETNTILQHTGYTLCYSEDDEQPYWVAYVLTANEVFATNAQRANNFHEDPYIPTGSATLADYKGSGYDRGHMIPAADLKWSEEAMSDSFYMSNMSPQVGAFNRGIWADLESIVRTFAAQNQAICVVTGPVLTDGPYEKIGENEVSVPNYYYKAILDYTYPEYKAIGFLLPNEGSKASLESFAVTIDELEELTGFDFFPLLPDDEEKILESTFDVSLWDFTAFNSSTIARKYGYDLENEIYTASQTIVEVLEPEPQTAEEYILYFLYTNFGEYKIMALEWFHSIKISVLSGFSNN